MGPGLAVFGAGALVAAVLASRMQRKCRRQQLHGPSAAVGRRRAAGVCGRCRGWLQAGQASVSACHHRISRATSDRQRQVAGSSPLTSSRGPAAKSGLPSARGCYFTHKSADGFWAVLLVGKKALGHRGSRT
jgi:hypothetical protein